MEDKLDGNAPGVRSRREFLGALGTGAAVLGAGGFLGACGSSSSTTTAPASSSKPIRGGTLRVGLTGGASTDTLDPLAQVTPPDLARSPQIFNSLIAFDSDAQLRLQLAEEMVPNSNATEWTIRVRKGITFHNGKTLGADDVIFTLQQCLNPKSPARPPPCSCRSTSPGSRCSTSTPCVSPSRRHTRPSRR